MTKHFWINLPVKDIARSKAFFSRLGFSFNAKYENEQSAALMVGDNEVVVMLFVEPAFQKASRNAVADATQGTEVLLSIDAATREEVDEMAKKAEEAGGTVFGKPTEIQGWMYGCGFTDLDGHRWNTLFRDMSRMPKG
jgi:predicted lactoylglutathione lyase